MSNFSALRQALAGQAARRTARGLPPGAVLPRLRLLTTAELLCPAAPPVCAADACAELEAVCSAARCMLRRRDGWLRFACADKVLPVLVRPALLQAAVLAWMRGALMAGADEVSLVCAEQGGAVRVSLCGGADPHGDAAALLERLAREAGGTALFLARGAFGAALRLPRADGLPLRKPARAEDLLADRYALPRLYLDGFCAEPEL